MHGRAGRAGLVAVLLAAMGASTFVAGVLAILASDIIDEFALSRERYGLLATALLVTAGFVSLVSGRFTDRVGGKNGLFVLFGLAAATYALYGIAPAYWVVVIGAFVGAVANSLANPTTNKLVSIHVPAGSRSVITGVKQSGVQGAVFVAGLFLPDLARAIGWRWAMLTIAGLCVVLVPIAAAAVPRDDHESARRSTGTVMSPGFVRWLATYGFLIGFAGSVTFLIPLFVEESIGLSADAGGTAAAIVGLMAFAGRIMWARTAERRDRYVDELLWIAVLAMFAAFVLSMASPGRTWLVWLGAGLVGLSSSSWNSVGMLAVIARSGVGNTGGASGIVQGGFLVGLGLGPPIFGRLVDRTGSYAAMWWLSIVMAAVSAVTCLWWLRRDRRLRARR